MPIFEYFSQIWVPDEEWQFNAHPLNEYGLVVNPYKRTKSSALKAMALSSTAMTITHKRIDTCRMCGERGSVDGEPYCEVCLTPRQEQVIPVR